MFSITDNERLRDAYALLMFMQSDVPASAEKKAAVKNMAVTIKREIRNYNNRPAPDVHIICADYDGRCPTGCWFAYTMEIFGGNRYGRNAPVTEWAVVKRSLHRLLCHGDAQRRFE